MGGWDGCQVGVEEVEGEKGGVVAVEGVGKRVEEVEAGVGGSKEGGEGGEGGEVVDGVDGEGEGAGNGAVGVAFM